MTIVCPHCNDRVAIEEGIYPKRFPTPVLAKAMADIIATSVPGRWRSTRLACCANSMSLGLTTISGLIMISPIRVRVGDNDLEITRYTIS